MKKIIEQKYKKIKNVMRKNNFEYRYLDKMMKNYREQDYGDASVGLGKVLESFAKTILDDEMTSSTTKVAVSCSVLH